MSNKSKAQKEQDRRVLILFIISIIVTFVGVAVVLNGLHQVSTTIPEDTNNVCSVKLTYIINGIEYLCANAPQGR